jgi:hypothetical protein
MSTASAESWANLPLKLWKRLSGRVTGDTLRTKRSNRDPNAKERIVWRGAQ